MDRKPGYRRRRKKLTGAGEYWATGGKRKAPYSPDAIAAAAAFGVALPAMPEPAAIDYPVLPANWDAVMMFCRGQWHFSMNGRECLDLNTYLGPGKLFDLYEVPDHRAMVERLRVMEHAALTALRAQEA